MKFSKRTKIAAEQKKLAKSVKKVKGQGLNWKSSKRLRPFRQFTEFIVRQKVKGLATSMELCATLSPGNVKFHICLVELKLKTRLSNIEAPY